MKIRKPFLVFRRGSWRAVRYDWTASTDLERRIESALMHQARVWCQDKNDKIAAGD